MELSKNWVKIGQTERLDNNLNPDFKTTINMSFQFETHQKIKFEVIDDDGGGQFETIGWTETTLGNVMSFAGRPEPFNALLENNNEKNKGRLGQIIVRAEAVKESNLYASYAIRGMQLPNLQSGCCGLGSTILPVRYEWHRSQTGNLNHFTRVYSSETIVNTRNPLWQP